MSRVRARIGPVTIHWFACTILRLSDGKAKFGRQKKAMEKGFGLVRWDPWKPDDDDGSADEEDDEEDAEYEEEWVSLLPHQFNTQRSSAWRLDK